MFNDFFSAEDLTGSFDTNDIQQNKVIAAISYIPLLFFIPLFATPKSAYAKFHANQGLILTILFIVLSVASVIICTVIGLIPFIGTFISAIVSAVATVTIPAFAIIGIVQALQGYAKKLPVIGDFLDIIH